MDPAASEEIIVSVTLGLAILRRKVTCVGVQTAGKTLSVVFERHWDRPAQANLGLLLPGILPDLDLTRKDTSLKIVLSSADLACGDVWTLPGEMTPQAASKIGSAVCESRCTSETLETLVVDTSLSESRSQAVALDRSQTEEVLKAVEGFNVTLLAAIPAVLSQVFGAAQFTQGGERFEVSSQEGQPAWRVYPVDGPDEAGSLSWKGQEIPFERAAAFAAALSDPEQVPNLLNSLPKHRKTFLKRFRDPLVSVAIGAALCLGALGVHFHRDLAREREETAIARRAEMQLWARYLPGDEPREGRLLKTMHDRLGDLGELSGGSEIPSALGFWGEIAKQMPDPESLGVTLESLDLAPDGGRISARVPAVKDDPLKNAAQLEGKLNQSRNLRARGDYEVRDGQVQVRLRMDYKP